MTAIQVRSRSGEFRHYPLTRNWHLGGILSASLAPVQLPDSISKRAVACARAIAGHLDWHGFDDFQLGWMNAAAKLLGRDELIAAIDAERTARSARESEATRQGELPELVSRPMEDMVGEV